MIIEFNLNPTIGIINALVEKIKIALVDYSEKVNYSTDVVASELLENALKYGVVNTDIEKIHFEMLYDEKEIIIKVSNGFFDDSFLLDFHRIFEKIKNTPDRESLYIERLQEVLDNPSTKQSQLGFYKILYETDYNINYEINKKIITVTAHLKMEG